MRSGGRWDQPLTAALKNWAMEYFKKELRKKHGGRLTQEAAVALATSRGGLRH